MREVLKDRRQRFQAQLQTLQVVSPLATLARGYSILLDERGQAIRSAAQTHNGQRLTARLNEGELQVRVEDNHLTRSPFRYWTDTCPACSRPCLPFPAAATAPRPATSPAP
jgi:hypothetical protein